MMQALKLFKNSFGKPRITFPFSTGNEFKGNQNIRTDLTIETILKNNGLNQFLTRVYNTTGLSILGSICTSCAVLAIQGFDAVMVPLCLGGSLAAVVGFISLSFMNTNSSK